MLSVKCYGFSSLHCLAYYWMYFLLCSYAVSVIGPMAFMPDNNNTNDIELLFLILILFAIFYIF